MDQAEHWHAFVYVGHERPADNLRMDPSQPYPPLEIKHWLRKPPRHFAEQFTNDDIGRKAASEWMHLGYEEYPSKDDEHFPAAARMKYVDDELRRGDDVVRAYYSRNGNRYVSRALVGCPKPGERCPGSSR